jgi:hypothetical protein
VQTPEPLQAPALTSFPLEQPAGRHVVPGGCRRQPPLPLHPPARPHVVGASAGQSFRGSAPSATGVQVPRLLLMLQAKHRSVQAVPQQMPLVQYPVAHCSGTVQAAPIARLLRQAPLSQKKPTWQSALVAHTVPHELPAQLFGVQARELPGWQTPLPSQVRAADSSAPVQLPGAQMVPAA